jgi:lipopolysaccharide/colanic/teichoic acid biosynthesis glycosyltransferase
LSDSPGVTPGGGLLYLAAKRGIDLLISGLVLGALLPLWLLVALAIRLTSVGPALFRNEVVGRDGRVFTYYKFRTMYVGQDDSHHRRFLEGYVRGDQPYAVERDPVTGEGRKIFKVVGDRRVTPLGRLLRRLSLDEIPQLINVLRGNMSVVGPRPPVLYEYRLYDDAVKRRLTVRPGITGLAQVSKRGTASFSEMVAYDLDYIRRRSLLLDLAIMVRTIPAVLFGRGHTG